MQSKYINRSPNSILEISTSDPMEFNYSSSLEKKATFAFAVSFAGDEWICIVMQIR